jgi:hypothetical protein
LSAFAPFLIGALGERYGLAFSFYACGAAFLLASFTALWVPETKGTELA